MLEVKRLTDTERGHCSSLVPCSVKPLAGVAAGSRTLDHVAMAAAQPISFCVCSDELNW